MPITISPRTSCSILHLFKSIGQSTMALIISNLLYIVATNRSNFSFVPANIRSSVTFESINSMIYSLPSFRNCWDTPVTLSIPNFRIIQSSITDYHCRPSLSPIGKISQFTDASSVRSVPRPWFPYVYLPSYGSTLYVRAADIHGP